MGGFRRDVRTHVWCAFGVLTLIRPITPDAGARWNPQHDTARLPEGTGSLRSGGLQPKAKLVCGSLPLNCCTPTTVDHTAMSVVRCFTRCLRIYVVRLLKSCRCFCFFRARLEMHVVCTMPCWCPFDINTSFPSTSSSATAHKPRNEFCFLGQVFRLNSIGAKRRPSFCMPPPSKHNRSLSTRRSLITTNTDRERSREVGVYVYASCLKQVLAWPSEKIQ